MDVKFSNVDYVIKGPKEDMVVFDNISLEFKHGQITTLIGKSASGKTLLTKMINGSIIPTNGEVTVGPFTLNNEEKVKKIDELRFEIAYLFENSEQQFFHKTVKRELLFSLESFKYRISEKEKRIVDALKMVGLSENYLIKNPFELSAGEKRKVALASVLIYNPKIIVLDKPTVGLDNVSKKNLIKLFKMLKYRYQKNIIIISEDVEFIHKLTDYIYVIDQGKIVLEGTKYQVFANNSLVKYNIKPPKIIAFEKLVEEKKHHKLGYRDEINDLIKDIYRHVS